ncbi:MAG: DUF1987 domain-containing protein [Crocinitomix sp.]|nr:DUF1987 domain-containing protein [Crocinitomix sp.]
MSNLILNASAKTPYFKLKDDGNFSFGGISMPEDAASFYFNIIDWLTDYYRNPKKETVITVGFRYLNSSSSRMILKMFQAFKSYQESGKTKIKCTWYYEEDDLDMRDYVNQVKKHADNIEFEILPIDQISLT